MTWNDKYTYAALLLGSIAYPLAQSFEHRLQYYKQWKFLWQGMLFTLAFFISWDIFFAKIGVWGFNDQYITGIKIQGLPIEEWLFFICIPFACIFIYECVRYFFAEDIWRKAVTPITIFLLALLIITAVLNYNKWYTGVKLGSAALFLGAHWWYFKDKYLGRFYVSWLLSTIPFCIVNGYLTYLPVVTYNNAENLGIRMSDILGIPFFNIPIEDNFYSMLLLLMNVSLFEYFRERLNSLPHKAVVS